MRIHLFFLRKEQLRLFVQMKQHLNGYFFFKFLFPCGEFRVEGTHAPGLRVFCRKVTHMLCIWIITDVKSRPVFRKGEFRFPGSKFLSNLVVMSLMFSTAVTAVPNYVIMSYLGLVDSWWAVILPAFSMSLGLFLMKNFMEQVPTALIDAASIDGASYFGMLWRVVMPAVKPAWITLFIVAFQSLWGATGGNFIYTENIKPLPAMLSQLSGSGVARTGVVAAISLLMFIVPVILFMISQSNVLETMATSGIKE